MENSAGIIMILGLILRIVGAVVCSNKAKELNRSTSGWGVFGFFMPIIAMIWIQFMKPVVIWDSNLDTDNNTNGKINSSD